MDQLTDFADDRLINGCIYCGGIADTRDHVPSRVFLEPPYPENLPVVGSCRTCNQGFSQDEQYLVCLMEAARAGSADPDKITRPSVARSLRRAPALQARIAAARTEQDGQVMWGVEGDRIATVMLKLARGHAAFELSQPCRQRPDHFWCGPLITVSDKERDAFEAPHEQIMLGEVGSRGLQRLIVAQACLQSEEDKMPFAGMLINDWTEVQEGRYRYLAIDDVGGIAVRIVISEYLGCEVIWKR